MELPPQPDLIWLTEFLERCPISGETIFAEEVELAFTGRHPAALDWTLGRCRRSRRWYGLMEDLLAAQMEEGLSLSDVDGFLVDGEPVEAGIWVGPPVGAVPWAVFKQQMSQLFETTSGPPPSSEAVRALPLLSESWEIGLGAAAWFLDEDGRETPSYAALVLDPATGIRGHALRGETPHRAEDLAPLILQAAAQPAIGVPGRPLEVRIADAGLAQALGKALAEADIAVRATATPMADDVLDDMVRSLRRDDDPPFFTPHDEKDVRAFFRAAKSFYGVRPWDRIDGDKYVAFRLGDGPWGYLSVMGQMGEELGLSYFEDWLQLCRFIHNQPSPFELIAGSGEEKPFEAAGALEGLTLEPLQALRPEDADYVKRLGVKTPRKGLYPFVRRFTLDGLEAPRLSLFAYQALMEALAEAVSKRRARSITSIKQTFTVGEVPITLRYPARGDESLADDPGSFRLIVTGVPESPVLESGKVRIEVDAPGAARLDDVALAIRREGGDRFWVNAVTAGEYALWDYDMGRGAPCPRVAHLAKLSELGMAFYSEPYPLQVLPRMTPGATEIQVRVVRR